MTEYVHHFIRLLSYRSELEEAHLETAASKARKQSVLLERTISVYPHCVVRILFPNRLALQGVFKSTESIQDVIQFVVSFLETSNLEFYLCKYSISVVTIVDVQCMSRCLSS